uniref:Uncharacterized protein n=1 Tax=Siphoviridae sp. ct4T77 TaxID=2823563 RepID=A0A8S5L904_9CAUD|nr:MAG TPA: hypothetical protein [Siphoviridae sp. ct4T77]
MEILYQVERAKSMHNRLARFAYMRAPASASASVCVRYV